MALKKTEIYSSLWQSCNDLRGGMDASQYKDYILTLLFLKYVSDKVKHDRKFGIMVLIPEGAHFEDIAKLKGDKNIGDRLNKIISELAKANEWQGMIDVADFDDASKLGSGKEKIDRLSSLIGTFEHLNFGGNQAQGDDLLGDAYEYLMRHFATESGKSKGQFYTPAEVSRVLAKVVGINDQCDVRHTVYDPTCGSGSLLLKASDRAPNGLTIYGQEMDVATSALCQMNMILHGKPEARIHRGNTLSSPAWEEANGDLKRFDFAVANPPFSFKSWTTGMNLTSDPYGRFEYGTPPDKNGDYAFLLHILKSLKSTGKGAVILPHGVLFRGNAEATIRRNLLRQSVIKGIIGLPANLFYGTGIPACIIVLDKENTAGRNGVFMVDASKGFQKDGNKNRLRSQDIHKIVDVFNHQRDIPGYARMVPMSEIADNDHNLNIPRYIDASEAEDIHNLTAHLNGGIPNDDLDALDRFWQVFPNLRHELFAPAPRAGFSNALVKAGAVKEAILNHPDFIDFSHTAMAIYQQWEDAHISTLKNIKVNDDARALMLTLSEDLLHRFTTAPLLDRYDVYQLFMEYWHEPMQDDVFLLTVDDWEQAGKLRTLRVARGEKLKETPDLIIKKVKYKADLIPPTLMINRFFTAEQAELDQLQAAKDAISQQLENFIEENTGEVSEEKASLEDARNDNEKINKASVIARLKVAADAEELALLQTCKKLFDREAAANKKVKEAQEALDTLIFNKYPTLDVDEIKNLIVEDKWLASLKADIQGEVDRVTQQLANRLKTLEERYADPLPALVKEVESLSAQVDKHLRAMGLEW